MMHFYANTSSLTAALDILNSSVSPDFPFQDYKYKQHNNNYTSLETSAMT